jgi:hypothetical protein
MNNNTIYDYEALVRRANKIVSEYNRYPLMPEGDLSIEFIKNVFNFNPLFVLDDLKRHLINTLLDVTDYKYSKETLQPIVNESYGKQEKRHQERILDILIKNYKQDVDLIRSQYMYYIDLRPMETKIFYYAYSIFYIGRVLHNDSALMFARTAISAIGLLYCEKSSVPAAYGVQHSGWLLALSDFKEDQKVYSKLVDMIENEIMNTAGEDTKQKLSDFKKREKKNAPTKGCYIATCVYGSYNCPEVWVLRRFRDRILSNSYLGRLFIRIYYALSPKIVAKFGNRSWFVRICKAPLDIIIRKLQAKRFDNTPYVDRA